MTKIKTIDDHNLPSASRGILHGIRIDLDRASREIFGVHIGWDQEVNGQGLAEAEQLLEHIVKAQQAINLALDDIAAAQRILKDVS